MTGCGLWLYWSLSLSYCPLLPSVIISGSYNICVFIAVCFIIYCRLWNDCVKCDLLQSQKCFRNLFMGTDWTRYWITSYIYIFYIYFLYIFFIYIFYIYFLYIFFIYICYIYFLYICIMVIWWLVSGERSKSCSSDVESVNLSGKQLHVCTHSQLSLVNISYWNSHLFYSANNLQVVKLSQNCNYFSVYSKSVKRTVL